MLVSVVCRPHSLLCSALVVEPKFVCPMHSEARQTGMLEFGAERCLLQGPSKENWVASAQRALTALRFWGKSFYRQNLGGMLQGVCPSSDWLVGR